MTQQGQIQILTENTAISVGTYQSICVTCCKPTLVQNYLTITPTLHCDWPGVRRCDSYFYHFNVKKLSALPWINAFEDKLSAIAHCHPHLYDSLCFRPSLWQHAGLSASMTIWNRYKHFSLWIWSCVSDDLANVRPIPALIQFCFWSLLTPKGNICLFSSWMLHYVPQLFPNCVSAGWCWAGSGFRAYSLKTAVCYDTSLCRNSCGPDS